jgi:hypothetical protein
VEKADELKYRLARLRVVPAATLEDMAEQSTPAKAEALAPEGKRWVDLAARGATLLFCVAEFISEIAMSPRPSEL